MQCGRKGQKEVSVKPFKIVLADDDLDFRNAIQKSFEGKGFEVTTADNGDEALTAVAKVKPDLIVLDVMMPGKDGFAVCHELKNSSKTSSIPVLMLTSLASNKQGKNGAEKLAEGHNADGFLEKPVDPATLIKTAHELIENRTDKTSERKPHILLIDDDPDFIAALKSILDANYEVQITYSGEDGLKEVNKDTDLILLDVVLPGKDGFAVCKELKENEKTRLIPVIMLTSIGEKLTEPDFAKALAVTHRADDYIEKPVDPEILISRITELIGPKRRLV